MLYVREPFHLDGVMLGIGVQLSAAQEKSLRAAANADPSQAEDAAASAAIDDARHKLAMCIPVAEPPADAPIALKSAKASVPAE